GAQIAFVASGNLRLNQDIPAGADITERHLVEIFQYPATLKLLRIRGSVLKQVVARSVEAWTGNGWWLQISGFAFKHDPSTESAANLTLLTPSGPKPISDDDVLLAVTHDFLITPATGQDGYTMLKEEFLVKGAPSPDMRRSVEAAVLKAGNTGIAPEVEGRICNPERPKCLALSPETSPECDFVLQAFRQGEFRTTRAL
ncbi:MAG: hypothetical protein GY953_34520, partial [bacterium]|nr:hypothetical protein [bacterium]